MENFDSLRQVVYSGKVNAAEFVLAAGRLGSEDIDALAKTYLEKGNLALLNYSITESEAEQSIVVRGTGGNLPFTGMEVTATFRLQEGAVVLDIAATVTEGWNFSAGFPLLKLSLLAGLRFSPDSGFRLASRDIQGKAPKNTLFFEGRLTLDSVLAGLRILFGNVGPKISGTIDIVAGAPQMTLSTSESSPVDIGFSSPFAFAFEACSRAIVADESEEGSETLLPDARVFFRFRTAIPFTAQGKAYTIPLAATVYDPASSVVLSIDLESFTDFIAAGIPELTSLTNRIPLAESLSRIEGLQLAEQITLKDLLFYIDPTGPSKLTAIVLSVESKKPWTIVRYNSLAGTPITVTLDTLRVLISIPMATRSPEVAVTGVVETGNGNRIVLSLFAPDLTFVGNLEPRTKISLKETVRYFTGADLPSLPDVTVAAFALSLHPGTAEFSTNGTIIGDWSIPLGILSDFALKELSFSLSRTADGGFSGSVGGSAMLGDAAFDASYEFPGSNFMIGGKIPSVRMGKLIGDLCGNVITLPDSLDFTLRNSEFAVTKSGGDYIFFLQTELPDAGTLFFEIRRTSAAGWGAAVGVDLSAVQRLGDLPGFGFMNAIDLRFERMALVLSSVDLPSGYTFPDLTAYKSTAPAATGKVKIPSGIGTPKQGINFYAQFAFGDKAATRDESLLKLYDFFSLQRVVLDVAVQVSYKGGNLSALMLAGAGVEGSGHGIGGGNTQYNMNLAAYLAVRFAGDGNAALFLRGLLTLSAPATTGGEKLTFAAELGLQPNGFYAAGSMTGAWVDPFGIQGLSVSDAGLMVGMNWEGIPSVGFAGTLTVTGFQGSLACIVNSENPVNSVLAGSLSDLSLGDVVNTFVGIVAQPDPTAKEIIAVLKNVSVEGINSFTIPGTSADAFDSRDLKSVAAAFAEYGKITLTPNPEGTMLVPGVKGERWFITDKTGGVTHYEIVRQGEGLTVRQQAQLYLSPSNARIGMIEFPEGYQIYGQLNIFGFKQRTDVMISINRGIGAEVRMSRIDLFGGLLRVERAPGDTRDDGRGGTTPDGPYLSISTYPRPPYNTPHFYISGSLSFLGILDQVMDIEVSEKGVHVLIARKLFGTDFNFSFDFKASPLYLAGGGTAGMKLNPKIDLSRFGLGTYNILDVDFTATLAFAASGEKLSARASGNFYFSIPQFNVKLGPYSLDVDLVSVDRPLAKLQNLLESAIGGIGSLAQDLANRLLSDAKNFAELVKSGVITVTDSLDSVLKKVFNVSLADLYATTQCFAGTRLAPRMMRPLAPMPAYTPAPGEAFPGSAAPPDDPLARLRELRDDLGDSPTGQWVLNIYNTLSEPLVHLYDFRPSDPDDPTFDQVLNVYNGYQVYSDLLKLLKTAGTSQPFNVTQDFLNNGMNLVSAIIDLAEFYSQTGDPKRKEEGELIVKGISGLLNQVSLLQQFQGLNYDQIREKVKTMAPPPSPFA